MILVILDEREEGKTGSATAFFNSRCGSVLMMQILSEEDLLRECGTGILLGLSLMLSTICCLVVRQSQIAVLSLEEDSESDSSSGNSSRLFLDDRF